MNHSLNALPASLQQQLSDCWFTSSCHQILCYSQEQQHTHLQYTSPRRKQLSSLPRSAPAHAHEACGSPKPGDSRQPAQQQQQQCYCHAAPAGGVDEGEWQKQHAADRHAGGAAPCGELVECWWWWWWWSSSGPGSSRRRCWITRGQQKHTLDACICLQQRQVHASSLTVHTDRKACFNCTLCSCCMPLTLCLPLWVCSHQCLFCISLISSLVPLLLSMMKRSRRMQLMATLTGWQPGCASSSQRCVHNSTLACMGN